MPLTAFLPFIIWFNWGFALNLSDHPYCCSYFIHAKEKHLQWGHHSAACLQKTVSQSYRSLVQRVCCGTLKTSDKSRVAHGLFLKNCSLKLHSKIIFFSFFYLCARHYILGNLHKPGVGNSWPQGPVTCRF